MCRMGRLLSLSRAADETAYQASLSRSGTPAEREEKGITVQRAVGLWLSDVSESASGLGENGEGGEGGAVLRRKREASGGGEGAQKVVAEWRREDEGDLDEESGFKFRSASCLPQSFLSGRPTVLTFSRPFLSCSEGTILRFTRAPSVLSTPSTSLSSTSYPTASFTPSPSSDPNGPKPPAQGVAQSASAAMKGKGGEWFVQGTVLEVRDGRLVVAFEEGDVWEMGDEAYQFVLFCLSSFPFPPFLTFSPRHLAGSTSAWTTPPTRCKNPPSKTSTSTPPGSGNTTPRKWRRGS